MGDPLKDTSGPSLNILIKLMAVESLVFAPFFQAHTPNGESALSFLDKLEALFEDTCVPGVLSCIDHDERRHTVARDSSGAVVKAEPCPVQITEVAWTQTCRCGTVMVSAGCLEDLISCRL